MTEEIVIKTEDLWYAYAPDIVALKGIDLEIRKGEIIALIGQNGGGKTTLAKHFNGLLKPTKGRVLVKGIDTRDKPANELSTIVGYVFQNPMDQIFSKTVFEEVAFGPKNIGLSDKEVKERTEEALEKVGLLEYSNAHPLDLDFGKLKLLTIASIISLKPEVYCLDEPTTGQDHIGRKRVAELVKKLNEEEGATVIVITHDMNFVAEVAERVILMADGKILADGPVREIFQQIETLRKAQIKPPQVTLLFNELHSYGLPKGVIKLREAAEILGDFLKKKSA